MSDFKTSKPAWLNTAEAAAYLGVCQKTLRAWTKARIIECYAPSHKRFLYAPDVLDEFIASRIRPAWRSDRDKNRRRGGG